MVNKFLDKILESLRTKKRERNLAGIENKFQRQVSVFFLTQGKLFLEGFVAFRHTFVEASGSQVDVLFDQGVSETIDVIYKPIYAANVAAYSIGGAQAIVDLGMDIGFNVSNPRALNFLANQAARSVTGINETTRKALHEIINDAGKGGWSYDKTAKEIKKKFVIFSGKRPQKHIRSRAHLIAITESGNAYEHGALEAGKQLQDLGILMVKKWSTVGDARVSQGCEENENQGWIDHDDAFSSGHDAPLRFPGCYSDDTEVYTKRGWIKFKDACLSDKCLSLNPNTFDLSWQKIRKTYKFREDKKMIRFRSKNMDLLVSHDHNIFYRTSWSMKADKNDWKFERADKFLKYPKSGEMFRGSNYNGFPDENDNEKYGIGIGENTLLLDEYLFLMGIYLSEGSITQRGDNWYQTTIHQSQTANPKNYNKIKAVFESMDLNWRFGKDKFYCNDKALGIYLSQFGKSHEKHVPDTIKILRPNKIRVFLDVYCMGDGHRRIRSKATFPDRNGGKQQNKGKLKDEIVYTTSSKRMADDLGELIIKVGKRPSFNLRKARGSQHRNGYYMGNHDMWDIRECHATRASVQHMKIEEVEYNGFIYCVDIENHHTLLVRRNGKVVWSGNCRCDLMQRRKKME